MEKALELRDVSIVRKGKYILRSVDLDIFKGENVAVIGPNGSGKTTLIKLLRGDIRPYYDEDHPAVMRIFGMERWNLFDIRGRMGVVSMDLQSMFRPETRVDEVICSGFFNSLDVFRNYVVTEGMVEAVRDAAVMMGIEDLLDREIENLSLGEMRRALIARALVTKPDLLVLDEPMTGLDIVMITHDLTDIPASVKRVVMIKDGEVYADGDKEDLLRDDRISDLYGADIKVESQHGIYRMRLTDDVIQ